MERSDAQVFPYRGRCRALMTEGVEAIAYAQAQSTSEAQKSAPKTVVSGGDNMATYIRAVQANFGKPNVTVTLPTMGNEKK
jgi:hypothetical protein